MGRIKQTKTGAVPVLTPWDVLQGKFGGYGDEVTSGSFVGESDAFEPLTPSETFEPEWNHEKFIGAASQAGRGARRLKGRGR